MGCNTGRGICKRRLIIKCPPNRGNFTLALTPLCARLGHSSSRRQSQILELQHEHVNLVQLLIQTVYRTQGGDPMRFLLNSTIKASTLAWNWVRFICALILSKAVRLVSKGKIWLIGEREDEARDNAYHFFKYVRTRHPEIRAYYVISPSSPDYKKVSSLGNVIHWGSFRHYVYWCLAHCVISSQPGRCQPGRSLHRLASSQGIVRHFFVYLKHGVTAISFPHYQQSNERHYDLICAAAPAERDFLIRAGGYDPDVVQLTGFCRFDALHDPVQKRRQVLFMPTWRKWFVGLWEAHGRAEALSLFRQSEYFRAYSRFLQSEELREILNRYKYEIVFYPHHDMQRYLEAFREIHEGVILADQAHYDVQELLKESAVLITDFSSVSFDFAYMGKPVIYYLPDEDRFFENHHARGYFDFSEDGFGPVARTPDDTIAALASILECGAVMKDEYKMRVSAFFPLRDASNSKRVLEAIERRLGEQL